MKAIGQWFGEISDSVSDNLASREGTPSRVFVDKVLAPIGRASTSAFNFVFVTVISEILCESIIWGGLKGSGSVLSKLGEWAGNSVYWTVWGSGKVLSKLGEWGVSSVVNTGLALKYVFYDLLSVAFIWKTLNSEALWNKSVTWANDFKEACGRFSTWCGLRSTESKTSLATTLYNSAQVCRDKMIVSKDFLTPYLVAAKDQSVRVATFASKSLWHGAASTWNSLLPSTVSGSHYFFGTIAWLCTGLFDIVINLSLRNAAWLVSTVAKSVSKVSVAVSTSFKKSGPEIDQAPGAQNMWWKTVQSFWPKDPSYQNIKMPMPQWE
jgi:hypothetical protein